MVRRSRQTFQEILVAVAPLNATAVEEKARGASELAKAYPQLASTLAAVEDRLLRHLWRVLSEMLHDAVPGAPPASSTTVRMHPISPTADERVTAALSALGR
jgi:hypothetical protein